MVIRLPSANTSARRIRFSNGESLGSCKSPAISGSSRLRLERRRAHALMDQINRGARPPATIHSGTGNRHRCEVPNPSSSRPQHLPRGRQDPPKPSQRDQYESAENPGKGLLSRGIAHYDPSMHCFGPPRIQPARQKAHGHHWDTVRRFLPAAQRGKAPHPNRRCNRTRTATLIDSSPT